MDSSNLSAVLRVLVFSGFVFRVDCHNIRRQCFEVESRTICYFTPNVSSVDWDTAWKTCRELDATLPVILNEKEQKQFEGYLSEYFPVNPVWTAGRYVGSRSEWRWLNGRNFSGSDNPSCPYKASYCPYETQAVLTKDLSFTSRYPGSTYAFICSYPDNIKCRTESQMSIKLKGGCLSWNPNHRLPLNKARNECLKHGGDLATFSEDSDLQALSSAMTDNDTIDYWIGLHRKWWIWNATDIRDIKYNLLDEYVDQTNDCLFIRDERSKWSRDKCSRTKNVICQIDFGESTSEDVPSSTFTGIIVGSALLVLLICIIILVIIIIARRKIRNTSKKANDQVDIDQTYEDLHNAGAIETSVDTGIYTNLVPTQLRRNVDHHEDHVYEDV